MDLSVVLITLNEEENIKRCLEALPSGAEIILLDSASKDKTKEIAEAFGAKVYFRAFDDFGSQKNAAIQLATRSWVLSLDADEVLTGDLRQEIEAVVKAGVGRISAYKIKRDLVFQGRTLRFGSTRTKPTRLFLRGKARFEGKVHEELKVDGPTGDLNEMMLHYSYKNLTDYFARFNRYTSMVANEKSKNGRNVGVPFIIFRSWFDFIWFYIFCFGFLDGYEGYLFAYLNRLSYALVKYAKLKEIRDRSCN